MFGCKLEEERGGCRSLRNGELHNLGCERRASWGGGRLKIVFDKAKGKGQLDRRRHRWNNNIKLDATYLGYDYAKLRVCDSRYRTVTGAPNA